MIKMDKNKIDIKVGLTTKEIKERIEKDLVNYDTSVKTKSIKMIICNNLFTLFNIINLVLALAICFVNSHKNLLFLGVVICNTLISTVQEIRAKRTIDKLSVLSATKAKVVRNKKEQTIDINEIVLDDIIKYQSGNQVITDIVIRKGKCEVNESFITGEAEPVTKKEGDTILSGSFLISGNIIGQVTHIGKDNYVATISSEAKYIKKVKSEIMQSLNTIIKVISIVIIPVGFLLLNNQLTLPDATLKQAVVNTVAALVGMIPEGLVLLTSTVFAISVVRLSKYHVLVQELYCIETLARVDTLCLDKTGTITEGNMEVVDIINLNGTKEEQTDILNAICTYTEDTNYTIEALKKHFKTKSNKQIIDIIPFSSEKKYSGIICEEGEYLIGAPEFLIDQNQLKKELNEYSNGNRLLLLVHKKNMQTIPLSLILIRDKMRKDAKETLNFFKQEGVNIKIISGDNINTVLTLAKRAGLENPKAIDMSTVKEEEIPNISEQYNIFGRVLPKQKKLLIEALKKNGHTVAMTGDGVNDVLALKEADCSIALSNGSDAARNVSQLVLLKDHFNAMPKIVAEGRRSINNLERSASLFLTKTTYATILALIFIFIEEQYPFMPIQLTLTSAVTIGVPSFILALQPNKNKIKGKFINNVMSLAVPGGLTIVTVIMLNVLLSRFSPITEYQTTTIAVLVTAYTGFLLVYKLSKPLNLLRTIMIISLIIAFLAQLIFLKNLYSLAYFNIHMLIISGILMAIATILFNMYVELTKKFIQWKAKHFPRY